MWRCAGHSERQQLASHPGLAAALGSLDFKSSQHGTSVPSVSLHNASRPAVNDLLGFLYLSRNAIAAHTHKKNSTLGQKLSFQVPYNDLFTGVGWTRLDGVELLEGEGEGVNR